MTRKRHIVVVDDEPNIGRSLRLILEGEGYRVSVFDSMTALLAERNRAAADMKTGHVLQAVAASQCVQS